MNLQDLPNETIKIIVSNIPKLLRYPLLFVSKWLNSYVFLKLRDLRSTWVIPQKYIKGNYIDLLKWYHINGNVINEDDFTESLSYGKLEIAKWINNDILCDPCRDQDNNLIFTCSIGKNVEVTRWCYEKFPFKEFYLDEECMVESLLECDEDTFNYVYIELGHPVIPSIDLLKDALNHGNLRIAKWIISKLKEYGTKFRSKDKMKIMTSAVSTSNITIEFLEYLKKEKLIMPGKHILDDAVCSENLDVVKWVFDNKYIKEDEDLDAVYETIGQNGSYDILEYLCEKKYYPSKNGLQYICVSAIHYERMDIYKDYSKQGKIKYTDEITYISSFYGYYDIMKQSIRSKYLGDEYVISNIIKNGGSYELLEWCYKKGCKINKKTIIAIVDKKYINFKALKWCIRKLIKKIYLDRDSFYKPNKNYIEEPKEIMYLISRSLTPNKEEIIKWCLKHGVPMDYGICDVYVRSGNMKMAKWCIDNGSIPDKVFVNSALTISNYVDHNEYIEFLDYLCKRNIIKDDPNHFKNLIKSRNYVMLKWMLDNMYQFADSICRGVIHEMKDHKGTIYYTSRREVLYWLLENRYRMYSVEMLASVILLEGVKILDILESKGLVQFSKELYKKIYEDKEIVEWFDKREPRLRTLMRYE